MEGTADLRSALTALRNNLHVLESRLAGGSDPVAAEALGGALEALDRVEALALAEARIDARPR